MLAARRDGVEGANASYKVLEPEAGVMRFGLQRLRVQPAHKYLLRDS